MPTKTQMIQAIRNEDYESLIDMVNQVCEPGHKVYNPSDLAYLVRGYGFKKQEHFIVLMLDSAHQVVSTEVVTKGLLSKTLVDPREVFYLAIKRRAAAIIIAHNHPSGDASFSDEDKAVTMRLKNSGELLGIQVLDHILITRTGIKSYLNSIGML